MLHKCGKRLELACPSETLTTEVKTWRPYRERTHCNVELESAAERHNVDEGLRGAHADEGDDVGIQVEDAAGSPTFSNPSGAHPANNEQAPSPVSGDFIAGPSKENVHDYDPCEGKRQDIAGPEEVPTVDNPLEIEVPLKEPKLESGIEKKLREVPKVQPHVIELSDSDEDTVYAASCITSIDGDTTSSVGEGGLDGGGEISEEEPCEEPWDEFWGGESVSLDDIVRSVADMAGVGEGGKISEEEPREDRSEEPHLPPISMKRLELSDLDLGTPPTSPTGCKQSQILNWLDLNQKCIEATQVEHYPRDLPEMDAPEGLLTTELYAHQRQALQWMVDKENSRPIGGILADDQVRQSYLGLVWATMDYGLLCFPSDFFRNQTSEAFRTFAGDGENTGDDSTHTDAARSGRHANFDRHSYSNSETVG